jgi:Putative esterase
MGVEVGYYIYLPPEYETSQEKYPVVYHLHGGRPGAENKAVRLASYVDAAIQKGTIKPTIYVFPNGGPVSWYDMPEMKQGMGESVFVKELVPHIDATYRTWGTREGRALEGYSHDTHHVQAPGAFSFRRSRRLGLRPGEAHPGKQRLRERLAALSTSRLQRVGSREGLCGVSGSSGAEHPRLGWHEVLQLRAQQAVLGISEGVGHRA